MTTNATPAQAFSEAALARTREIYEMGNYFIMRPWPPRPPRTKPGHTFYLHIIQGWRYTESASTSFASVSLDPKTSTSTLRVNPHNCQNLDIRQFAGLTVHETSHLLFQHPFARELRHVDNPLGFDLAELMPHLGPEELSKALRELVKRCMDAEINPIVVADGYTLPEGVGLLTDEPARDVRAVFPSNLVANLKMPAPPDFETWRVYAGYVIACLRKRREEREQQSPSAGNGAGEQVQEDFEKVIGKPLDGDDEPGDGDGWDAIADLSPEDQQHIREALAERVRDAIETAGGEGKLPGRIAGAAKALVAVLKPETTWTQGLTIMVARCGTPELLVKRNRENRHGLLGYPVFTERRSIGVVVDTSGSVTNDGFGIALGTLLHLQRVHDLEVYVQETDYGPSAPMWRLSDRGVKAMYERNGMGGTNMRPGIDRFLEQIAMGGPMAPGALLVISDGELCHSSAITRAELAPYEVSLTWLFSHPTIQPFQGLDYAGTIYRFNQAIK